MKLVEVPSYSFPMVFLGFYRFYTLFPWFSLGFLLVSHGLPMVSPGLADRDALWPLLLSFLH